MDDIRHRHQAIYAAHAATWDAERSRVLFEKPWLDRLCERIPAGGAVLDLGCGAGEPIARYMIAQGYALTGVDFARPMLDIARKRFPDSTWIEADMRQLDLGRRFSGIVAWDSFFHLTRDEQRQMIPRLARHLEQDGATLLTVGPDDGEAVGRVGSAPVYHASLSPAEYADRLAAVGLAVEAFTANDPACAGHSVLLAIARAG